MIGQVYDPPQCAAHALLRSRVQSMRRNVTQVRDAHKVKNKFINPGPLQDITGPEIHSSPPTSVQCRFSVSDAGPALDRRWRRGRRWEGLCRRFRDRHSLMAISVL